MVKSTVYLPRKLKDSLTRLSKQQGRSEAEIIREAIEEKVGANRPPRPRIPLCEEGLGDSTAASRVDEFLEGFGRS